MGVTDSMGVTRRRVAQGLGALVAPAFIGRAYAARTIKLGFISPETGPIAAFGSADTFIVAEVRKTLSGGVDIGGKKFPSRFWCATASPIRAAPPNSPPN